jgi:hypothetical protein
LAGLIKGTLLVTDIRLIFLPVSIILPFKAMNIILTDQSCYIRGDLMLYLHKYTLQFSLSALEEVKNYPTQVTSIGDGLQRHTLLFKLFNEQIYEFLVCKYPNTRITVPDCDLTSTLYLHGLQTSYIDPIVWCNRIQDYINYEIRNDIIWLRWAKYLKHTCTQFSTISDRQWLKKSRAAFNLDTEYKRMYVHDLNWRLSDLNASYHFCPTYPSVLVFPGGLSDEDLIGAASQRSIGRLPALVWLHPNTKAPLCRAAQPLAGLSGSAIEYDKKMCLSIRASCPTLLPLRITDARPKLNANANAMQGKGFENVHFMGGSNIASLVFLGIDNIHVMRQSLAKLKESCGCNNSDQNDSSLSGSSTNINTDLNSNTISSSKWTHHIAGLLRGACSVADSLMLGHSVLVHCSDGWDRTAQLTTLAQILLDPYYRTIEGILVLIQKEWCAFGHKFEERLNRVSSLPKEVSPVFLQVLDCIYQLLLQYSNEFEYTETLLLVLVFTLQSGIMSTFRGNNERERVMRMRSALQFEDIGSDDLDYSSITFYIHLLLRTSNYAMFLTNAHYTPSFSHEEKVKYLRPRCSNHDIIFWKDGLFGLNPNLLYMNSLSEPNVDHQEAKAIGSDMLAR